MKVKLINPVIKMVNTMPRGTKLQIGEKFIEFLKTQEKSKPFYKTELAKAGLGNPKTVEDWLDLYILFKEHGPRLRKIELGNNTLYEIIEE